MTDPKDKPDDDELKLPTGDEPEGKVDEPEDDDPLEESTAKVDSELDEAENDAERDEIRKRRREERKSRSQRNRERVEALERNLQSLLEQNRTLQQQVGSIQNANTGSQLAQIDQAIQQATNAAEHFKGVIAEAVSKQDGKTAAEATEYMLASRRRAEDLTTLKQNATRNMTAPKPIDPVLAAKSQSFLAKNKWYGGPQSNDPDSKVLTTIDNSLAAEGWNPTTDAYWQELEKRAAKYLPHRMSSGQLTPQPKPRNPTGGSSNSAGSGEGGSSWTLSAERKQALQDAGLWDDQAKRKRAIKSYFEYDKHHGKVR